MSRLEHERDIVEFVRRDEWMMDILRTAKTLQLPDWWVCAGFVRSKIWDVLHGYAERTPLTDIDVVYFDPSRPDEECEKALERKLRSMRPAIPWSVKNEARMHTVNRVAPYVSAQDAIAKFPETATALGLSLDDRDNVVLTAPHGIHDVVNMLVKPTPHVKQSKRLAKIYEDRIVKKNWKSVWPKVEVFLGM